MLERPEAWLHFQWIKAPGKVTTHHEMLGNPKIKQVFIYIYIHTVYLKTPPGKMENAKPHVLVASTPPLPLLGGCLLDYSVNHRNPFQTILLVCLMHVMMTISLLSYHWVSWYFWHLKCHHHYEYFCQAIRAISCLTPFNVYMLRLNA